MTTQREIFYTDRIGTETTVGVGLGAPPYKVYMDLGFTPKTAHYMLLAGIITPNTVSTGTQTVELYNANAALVESVKIAIKNTLDNREAFFAVDLDYSGGGGFADSYQVYYGGSFSALTTVSQGFMCAIEVLSSDFFTAFTTEKSSSGVPSQTYATWESRTITPSGTQDFLIIAYCKVNNNSVPVDDTVFVKLNDGTSDYGEQLIITGTGDAAEPTAETRPWCFTRVVTLSSSTTFTIQVKCSLGNGYYVQGGYFIAIAMNEFSDTQNSFSSARSASTSTTYADKTTVSFTPTLRQEYYMIASHYHDSASTANRVKTKLVQDGVDIVEFTMQPPADTAANDYSHLWVKRLQCTADPTVVKSQYARFSGSFGVGIGESSIAVLQNVKAANLNLKGSTNLKGSSNLL